MIEIVGGGDEQRRRFEQILSSIPDLDAAEKERITELLDVGEWEIALENLCSQLEELRIGVPPLTVTAIAELGEVLGVSERYWSRLSE